MTPLLGLPAGCTSLLSIDPGAKGGWAYFRRDSHQWELKEAGLARPDKGERPRRVFDLDHKAGRICVCVCEVPQFQKGDDPKRVNDLITLTLRAGLLVESSGADYYVRRTPHQWKGGVEKDVHNVRCLKHLTGLELDTLKESRRGDGTLVPRSEINNVIDAIGLGLVTCGRWF